MKMRVFAGDMPVSDSMRLQELQHFFRLSRLVTLVVLPDSLVRSCIDNDRLHCGRADIQTNQKFLHHLFPQLQKVAAR